MRKCDRYPRCPVYWGKGEKVEEKSDNVENHMCNLIFLGLHKNGYSLFMTCDPCDPPKKKDLNV